MLLCACFALIYTLVRHSLDIPAANSLVVALVVFLAYLLGRLGLLWAGHVTIIMVLVLAPLIFYLSGISSSGNVLFSLIWVSLAVPLSSQLLPGRGILLVTVFTMTLLLGSMSLVPAEAQPGLRLVFWFTGALALLTLLGFFRSQYNLQQIARQKNELEDSEARFRRLVDFSPEMIAVHSGGRYLYVNAAGLHLLGVETLEAVVGREVADFLHPDQLQSSQSRIVRGPREDDFAIITLEKLVRPDGSSSMVETTATRINFQGQQATQLVVRDVSERERQAAALRESEERYRVVSELISDFAYAFDLLPDGGERLVWAAGILPETPQLLQRADVSISYLVNLAHPEDRETAHSHFETVRGGQTHWCEFRIVAASGRVYWVNASGRPVWDEEGLRVVRIYGALQDITERAEIEAALKTHALQQAVVAELGLYALSDTPLHIMLDQAMNLTMHVLGANMSTIIEYQPGSQELTVLAGQGWKDGLKKPGSDWGEELWPALASLTLESQEPVIMEDLAQETRFPTRWLQQQKIASCASLIIHGHTHPFGVLSVYTMEPYQFTDDDINFLQSVANVLGTFMQQRRAIESEREQRILAEALRDAAAILVTELELSEVLDSILKLASSVVPAHVASTIMLFDEDNLMVNIVSYRGHDPAVIASFAHQLRVEHLAHAHDMIAKPEAVIIADTEADPQWDPLPGGDWIRSYLGAPIYVDGKLIGQINIDSDKAGAFTRKDADRLMAFANYVGIAIQNMRYTEHLEEQVQQRTHELQTEREQLATILDATGEGIFYTEDRIIRFINRALADMTGFAPHELIGKPTSHLYPDDMSEEERQQILEGLEFVYSGGTWRGENRVRRRDGTSFNAGLTISLVGGRPGEDGPRAVTIVRDISREKELEAQQSRFIANAAHELRSPITNLNTRLYLVQKQPDKVNEHVRQLEKITLRMNRLVEDLLDLSRFEHGRIPLRKQDTILQNLLAEIIEEQEPEAERKKLSLKHDMPLEPLHIFADPDRLLQVLRNLVANAINYSDEGGRILLRLWLDDTTGHAVIDVQDNGPGIPQEDLPFIFQPFYRAHSDSRGTGLGLSIAQEVTRQHEGELLVSSEQGRGCTFTLRLPLLPSSRGAADY